MAKLVDASVLGTDRAIFGGSSPLPGTRKDKTAFKGLKSQSKLVLQNIIEIGFHFDPFSSLI